MKYPKGFIKKVKAEYPGWKELHERMTKDDIFVGRYLDDSRGMNMSATQIVTAFDEGRQEDVKKAAEQCVRREKLYGEWGDLYDKQVKKQ